MFAVIRTSKEVERATCLKNPTAITYGFVGYKMFSPVFFVVNQSAVQIISTHGI